MKKIIAMLLALGSVFALVGCKGEAQTSSFTDLKKGQTLFVGTDSIYKNYQTETVAPQYLTCEMEVTYTLKRSRYQTTDEEVLYDSYYYYWQTEKVEDQVVLGNMTTKRSYTYSYLPYGSNKENVAVKTSSKVEYTYDYKGGFVTKDRTVNINLNGFFADWNTLCTDVSELGALIDVKNNKKYYVDVTTPAQVQSSVNTFKNTYYYIG